VAGFALYRLTVGTSSAPAAPIGYPQGQPQQPHGQAAFGQPQQIHYGQQPLGQPAPFGAQPSPFGGMPAPAPPPAAQQVAPPTYDPYARPPGS
jgi:hypothetical protein